MASSGRAEMPSSPAASWPGRGPEVTSLGEPSRRATEITVLMGIAKPAEAPAAVSIPMTSPPLEQWTAGVTGLHFGVDPDHAVQESLLVTELVMGDHRLLQAGDLPEGDRQRATFTVDVPDSFNGIANLNRV